MKTTEQRYARELLDLGPARMERPSEADARRELRALRAEALPILGWAVVEAPGMPGPVVRVPIVQADASRRPDVADLRRIFQQEGDPDGCDNITRWTFVHGIEPTVAALEVRQMAPARCRFKLMFRFDRHRELLEAAARSSLLGLATGPMHIAADGLSVDGAFFIQIETVSLRAALARMAR